MATTPSKGSASPISNCPICGQIYVPCDEDHVRCSECEVKLRHLADPPKKEVEDLIDSFWRIGIPPEGGDGLD